MIKVGKFNVRIVRNGESYGRNNVLVHSQAEPLVEFYDSRYLHEGWDGKGQFVSRYYVSTLQQHQGALSLHGGEPEWTVSSDEMQVVNDFIKGV